MNLRLWGIKENVPLNYIVCGQLISKDKFLHIKRNFSDNVLIFITEGTLFINSNHKNFEVSKNQFIFLKSGEEHYGYKESSGVLKYYWVHFKNNPEEISATANLPYEFPESGTIKNPARLIFLFKQLMDFSLDNEFYNKKVLDYSLSVLMMELCQSCKNINIEKDKKLNPVINDVCNWIKYNFQKDFSVDDLALEFGLQNSYLSKIFKQNTGKSIIQFTTEIRISAAKSLLQTFSIKETAYSCGFDDEKYFMKVFKKIEGITPTQYKQAFSLRNVNQ